MRWRIWHETTLVHKSNISSYIISSNALAITVKKYDIFKMTPTFSEDIAFSLLGDWEGVNKTLVPMKNLYHKSSINQLKGPGKPSELLKSTSLVVPKV